MTEDERDDLIDLLPEDMRIWGRDDEAICGFGGDFAWWRDVVGHPRAHRWCCKTCGCATSCTFAVFHDALAAAVVRELDRLGALKVPGPVTE